MIGQILSSPGPFKQYSDLFVQRIPRYGVKRPGGRWTSRGKPLSDGPVLAHLRGEYWVGTLSRWYPVFSALDFDDRGRGEVENIRGELGLDENSSMLFTSESENSYHLLVRPEYNGKPPTVNLLQRSFRQYCQEKKIEIYPQPRRPFRLPWGQGQRPLDLDYSRLKDWREYLFWFQKLGEFDLGSIPRVQGELDLHLSAKDWPALPVLHRQGVEDLLLHGLQGRGERHAAQLRLLYSLWRENVSPGAAVATVWKWIKEKNNGFSDDFNRHPSSVFQEIKRQVAHIWGKYDLARVYPDSCHNLRGFISKPDLADIVRISQGNLPRMKFLFNLVRYANPRRQRPMISIHSETLEAWTDKYLRHLRELEGKGILQRGAAYQVGKRSKGIILNWTWRSDRDAVLFDGRSVENFRAAVKLTFCPEEVRAVLLRIKPRDLLWAGKTALRLFDDRGERED